MNYKAVVFDLDGTLLDTIGDILSAINDMQRKLGYKEVTRAELITMIGDGAKKMVERATRETDAKKLDLALETYNSIYKKTTGNTKPFDEITDLLDYLTVRGMKCAVLSNKPQADAEKIVARVLEGYDFTRVIGQSEEFPVKPDTRGLYQIVNDFKLSIDECLYVGDGEMDFVTPNRAGMRVINALWGYRTKEQLEAVGATEFIDTPLELIKYL